MLSSLPDYKSLQNCPQRGTNTKAKALPEMKWVRSPAPSSPFPSSRSLEEGCPVPHARQGGHAQNSAAGEGLRPPDRRWPGSPEQTQPWLWSVPNVERGATVLSGPHDVACAEMSCHGPSGAAAPGHGPNWGSTCSTPRLLPPRWVWCWVPGAHR